MMVRSRALIITLLLRCGDIEVNPGPMTEEELEKVDNSQTLTEDDFHEVYEELVSIIAEYYKLGIGLRLKPGELQAIRKSCGQDFDQAFTDVLLAWLRQRYNVAKFGPPTWRMLVKAVDSQAGGNNHALALSISRNHAVNDTTAPSPKRQKLASPIQTSQRDQSLTNLSQNLDRWSKLLATFYLVDDSLSLNWPPLRTVQFIQLSLVVQNKGARHIDLKTVYGKIDEVYGDKTNIAIKEVFKNVECRSLILFEGRPGSGKTTLMIKISQDWAKGELLQSKLVILVQLRRLYGKKDIYLSDLFRVACSTLSSEDMRGLTSYIEGTLGKDIVFILDGLDEYAPGSNEDSFIYKLIAKQFFSKSIVIVSSRPVATQPFRRCTMKLIEVVGFMEKEVEEYIYTYFEDDKRKADTLMKHLQHHPNLMNLCYLPLHCAMLVYLYEEDMILPKTETEFYCDFTLSTLVRCNCKKFGKAPSQFSTFNDLPVNEKLIFNKICRLAFEATVASKQVFKQSELQNIHFDNENEDVNSLGLVVIDRYFVKFGLDKTYTFLHLTLQEYLSAIHISRLSTAEQEAIIKEHGDIKRLFITWHFLFGTLDYSKDSTANLFKLMMEATQEVDNSCNLSIQCAFESQSDLACSHVIDFYKNKLTFSDLSLISTDVACIIHLLKCSKCTDIHLSLFKCMLSVDDATALLQGIGDCQLFLTLKYVATMSMHACCHVIHSTYRGNESNPQMIHCVPLLNALDVVSAVSAPNLVQLEVSWCYESLEEGLKFSNLKNTANLQALKFDCVTEIAGLEECFHHWPKLQELYLENYFETVAHAQAIIKELKHCPELEKLTFKWGDEVRPEGCIQHWPKRKELYLLDCNETVTYAEAVIIELKHCPELERLTFKNSNEISGLEECFQHWPKLKELYLGDYLETVAHAQAIIKELKHCPELEKLTFCGEQNECCLYESACRTLGETLQYLPKLQHIDLCLNVKIGDSGLAHLAKGITHCAHLKELK